MSGDVSCIAKVGNLADSLRSAPDYARHAKTQRLGQALASPVKVSTSGTFDGLVREVDLDARRFEIRGVSGIGAIRCVYGPTHDQVVRAALDAKIRVSGRYDTIEGHQPRFMVVDVLEFLSRPETQLNLPSSEV